MGADVAFGPSLDTDRLSVRIEFGKKFLIKVCSLKALDSFLGIFKNLRHKDHD
jgi:hypothetical protein